MSASKPVFALAIVVMILSAMVVSGDETVGTDAQQDVGLFPAVDTSDDPVAQYALRFLEERDVLTDSDATVIFSRQVSDDILIDLGFSNSRFEEGCAIPRQLVLLHGDFDVEPIMPSVPQASRTAIPARYLALTFDLRHGPESPILTASSWDLDGSTFKQLLESPLLPDPPGDRPMPDESEIVIEPCEPTLVPGGPADASGPTEGPWAPTAAPIPTPATDPTQP